MVTTGLGYKLYLISYTGNHIAFLSVCSSVLLIGNVVLGCELELSISPKIKEKSDRVTGQSVSLAKWEWSIVWDISMLEDPKILWPNEVEVIYLVKYE